MLFHFYNFSPCVVCMFGHKTIKNYFGTFGLESCFPVFLISQR